MELLQLRYFCALAESQHLSNTAKKLMIAPPSLSLTISKLEAALGIKLFNREKRRIYLNDNGRLFYSKIKQSLEVLDQAIDEMNEIRHQTDNTIRIALTSPLIWNQFFQEFQLSYPDIKLDISVISLNELNGPDFKYDFFMGNGWDIAESDWIIRQIGQLETTLLLVSKLHPFALRKTISVNELKDETFITLGSHNPTTNHFVQTLCSAYGFKPKNIIEANYFTRISHLKHNDGVVLISDLGFSKHFINDGTIHKIKVNDTKCRRYQTIAWKNTALHSRACTVFLNIALDYWTVKSL